MPDTCKIREVGEYVFAAHGLASSDVIAAVTTILKGQGDISTKSSSIRNSIYPMLSKAMQTDPASRISSTGIIVFAQEQNVLRLSYIKFSPRQDDKGSFYADSEVHACPGDCPSNGIQAVYVSPVGTPFYGTRADPLAAVQAFVRAEITRESELESHTHKTALVAGPLQVLRIRQAGAHEWVKRPDVCKNEQ